ncbi:MAG: GNAT family N-acetyltransferase [Candidatus Sumerlaeia bacterium]|nr:GNAT family N-acetyltransferase [Candidatus Sumerlaeia bacterium]
MSGQKRFAARLITPSERDIWEKALARAPNPLMPHCWDYLDWAAIDRGEPRRVVVESSPGNPVALVTFVERRLRGIRQWRHPAPATFGGICHLDAAPSESHLRDIQATLAEFLRRQVPVAEVILPPGLADARGFLWSGWRAAPHYNYLSRIDSEKALLDGADNAVRRQHAKAAKEGLEVRTGAGHLEDVLALAVETRRRQGFPPWVSENFHRNLTSAWEESDVIAVYTPGEDGRIEAGAVVGKMGERVAYLLGASRGSGTPGAPTLLQVAATSHCFARWGAYDWDWVGANTESVAQFKKKFRPGLEVGMRVTWSTGWTRLLARI